jgi:hypothetical protein
MIASAFVVATALAAGTPRTPRKDFPPAWPKHAWHLDLLGRTDFPLDVGVALDVETPQRFRFGVGVGVIPGGYLQAINAVSEAAGWYDEATGDLIVDTIRSAVTVHPVIGVRPFAKEGFVIDAGLKLAVLGGRNTTAGLVAGLTGQDIPESTSSDARDLRATATVGLATVRLGWVWEPVDRLAIRFDIGGAFTVFSSTTIQPPEGARVPKAWEPLTAAGATYVDDIMTTYVHTPTIGFAIGWRER